MNIDTSIINNTNKINKISQLNNINIGNIKGDTLNIFLLLFLITYVILAIFIFIKNPYNITTKYNTTYIISSLFGAFILLMIYLFNKQRNVLYKQQSSNSPTILSYIFKLISSFFILGLIISFIVGVIYLLKNAPLASTIILYLINVFIVIGILTIIYTFFKSYLKPLKKSFIKSILDIITYIPSLVLSFIEYMKEQYNITTKPVWILLAIELGLIGLTNILPIFLDKVVRHDGIMLLNKPTSLREEKVIGNFEILNKGKNKYNYNYSISSWIYLEAQSQSTNTSYTDKATILSYGGKPNIYYDGSTNEFIISAKIGYDEKIIYKTASLPYQKWVNIIINYQGGFMDIFIDNKLVLSVKNVVPYMTTDNIIIGKSNGIYGFISNVIYFNKTISKDKISWINKTTKPN